jgi:folate-dependent phosphoribosylglycinamide formyltransferase PurN
MKKNKKYKWLAFFSHSGSNIIKTAKKLKRYGFDFDLRVVCTQDNFDKMCDELIEDQVSDDSLISEYIIMGDNKPITYRTLFKDIKPDTTTLNGWMRIVPGDICRDYEIFNLHPAPIHLYPELKGKDPQERFYKNTSDYAYIGSVIHVVDEGVDEGEVVRNFTVANSSSYNYDTYIKTQVMTSDMLMGEFMRDRMEDYE